MSAYFVSARGMLPKGTLSPLAQELFGAYEPGAMYDPEITGTLFQDSSGTTPVTALEQPVGLMLDLSGRGNHAAQATTTKRPVLSRRVNLWTRTENLSSGWTLVGSTVTAAGTAPTGSAAWLMSDSAVNSTHTALQQATVAAARHTMRLLSKPQGGRYVYVQVGNGVDRGNAIFDLQTATVTDSSFSGLGAVSFFVSPLSDGWLLLSASAMSDAGVKSYSFGISSGPTLANASFLGDGTRTILFAEPSLTLATDARLPYQRVNTATDYDADPSKFPAYLRFDGVDDAMQTANIDFTSTDKMTVWAGITKLSDAANGMVSEFGSPESVNSGTFSMWAPINGASAPLGVTAKGISRSVAATTEFSGASSGVVAQDIGLSAPRNALRLNGATLATLTTALGGAFGNFPFHIGSRAGTSTFFNGRLYSLIVRGAQSSLSQIEATEAYIKQKMRLP